MTDNKEFDIEENENLTDDETSADKEVSTVEDGFTSEEVFEAADVKNHGYIEEDMPLNAHYQKKESPPQQQAYPQMPYQNYYNPYQNQGQNGYPYQNGYPPYPQHPTHYPPQYPAQYYQNPHYPQQNPYPPYAQQPYPYGYPVHLMEPSDRIKTYPPLKKQRKKSVRVFAWTMLVLFVLSLGGFIGTTIYYSLTNPPVNGNIFGDGNDYSDYFEGFEGFEGFDDFEDFEGFDGADNYDSTDDIPEVVPVPDDEKGEEVDADLNDDGIIINSQPLGEEYSAQEVYDNVLPSIVLVKAEIFYDDQTSEEGYGTGMFITDDGYILTNSHVVFDTKNVAVTITDNNDNEYNATVLSFDRVMDIAILKINGEGFTPVEFGSSDDLSLGQWVLAIGNPGGESFSKSITRGIVSGLNRGLDNEQDMKYIQTDAAISPGNSGGPLVNMYGQVVGITTAKITAEDYEGIGLAIPISDAEELINQLLSKGYVEGRVRLGITGANAAAVNTMLPTGVLIIEIVEEDSAFVGTDAAVGDVITHIDGERVHGLDDLSSVLLLYSAGDTVTVTLDRDGAEITVEIVLLSDDGETQK